MYKLNVVDIIEDKTATVNITDGNKNILYIQKYKYTNCLRNINLYFTDGVLLLNSEY